MLAVGSANLSVEAETAERSKQILVMLQEFPAFRKWVSDRSLYWDGWTASSGSSFYWLDYPL